LHAVAFGLIQPNCIVRAARFELRTADQPGGIFALQSDEALEQSAAGAKRVWLAEKAGRASLKKKKAKLPVAPAATATSSEPMKLPRTKWRQATVYDESTFTDAVDELSRDADAESKGACSVMATSVPLCEYLGCMRQYVLHLCHRWARLALLCSKKRVSDGSAVSSLSSAHTTTNRAYKQRCRNVFQRHEEHLLNVSHFEFASVDIDVVSNFILSILYLCLVLFFEFGLGRLLVLHVFVNTFGDVSGLFVCRSAEKHKRMPLSAACKAVSDTMERTLKQHGMRSPSTEAAMTQQVDDFKRTGTQPGLFYSIACIFAMSDKLIEAERLEYWPVFCVPSSLTAEDDASSLFEIVTTR
jgi:hypothetical protein